MMARFFVFNFKWAWRWFMETQMVFPLLFLTMGHSWPRCNSSWDIMCPWCAVRLMFLECFFHRENKLLYMSGLSIRASCRSPLMLRLRCLGEVTEWSHSRKTFRSLVRRMPRCGMSERGWVILAAIVPRHPSFHKKFSNFSYLLKLYDLHQQQNYKAGLVSNKNIQHFNFIRRYFFPPRWVL